MDDTTRMAIQAVVRGLFHGRVLGENQILAIMEALNETADDRGKGGHPQDLKELAQLASDIGKDACIGE